MSQYVLRYRGAGAAPADDVAYLRKLPGVAILDQSSRMLLVEAPDSVLTGIMPRLSNWIYTPERTIQLVDPRPLLRSC